MKTRVAVFVSGSGTNLQALIDAKIPSAEIVVVLCNKPKAYAIQRAGKHGIPLIVLSHRGYPTRRDYERELINRLEPFRIDLVVLAGFMRVLTPLFVSTYKNKIMNLHPAILPSFPGTHAIERAFNYGVKYTGCTVHFVDEGVDTGPIILQASVPILDDDNEDSLAERIHREEHRIYPEAVRLFSEGKLKIVGRRVLIDDG